MVPLVCLLITLPLLGLLVLLARPALDARWQHEPSHFWIVLAAGLATGGLAYAMGETAGRRRDARLALLSLSFLAVAGFLALHALATPGVLTDGLTLGFVIAAPAGLLIGGGLAAAASLRLAATGAEAVLRAVPRLRIALVAGTVAWAVVSLAAGGPIREAGVPERGSALLVVIGVAGVGLYAVAAVRFSLVYRARRATLALLVVVAMVLLAETMVAVAFSRAWHASWWEWHLLMLAAFGLVAIGAERQWHEERFSDLYLEQTGAGTRELSVLFCDLSGFTGFCESADPREVSRMLNTYLDAIVPAVRREGGEVDRVIGDALMVTFNRGGDQPDHAVRAARAGLALQAAASAVAVDHPEWPRYRVGINTGSALVVVLGTGGGRTYSVIGDTVNVAARLEGIAPVGAVAIGSATAAVLEGARTEQLGSLSVKGRAAPVDALLLGHLPDPPQT